MLTSRTNFVIWGLTNERHSHRYIHKGFSETLSRMGFETHWVADSRKYQGLVNENSIVIACGVAAIHMPLKTQSRYVLHNLDSEFVKDLNHINLQVLTKESNGVQIDKSKAKWDKNERVLFQPWGLSEPSNEWLNPNPTKSLTENWVGAIWDNKLRQGNLIEIGEFRSALMNHNIRFRRFGGTRGFSKNGLSSKRSFQVVNSSAIGAAIVGRWQKEHLYVPCRAFKNIAAGAIPISNSNLQHIFGDNYLHVESIPELVDVSLNLDQKEINERSRLCKKELILYTYERAIKRILWCLNEK